MESKGYLGYPAIRDLSNQVVLQNKLDDLNRKIVEVREYYNLHLLESLDSESKKLSSLTRVLIYLTAVLAGLTLLLVVRTFIK